jgi:hypothetical protein
MQPNFSALKRESDIRLLAAGANIAESPHATSSSSPRPGERLLSQLGWSWVLAASAAVVAVTWFVVHTP